MKKQAIIVGLATSFIFSSAAFAAIPSPSAVVEDKGYDLNYLMKSGSAQLHLVDYAGAGNPVYVKLQDDLFLNLEGAPASKDAIPALTFYDKDGQMTQYAAKDGDVIGEVEGELKVESVSAINSTQLKVVFDKKVDEDTAINAANYYIGLTKDDGKSLDDIAANWKATLSKDGKTVIWAPTDLAATTPQMLLFNPEGIEFDADKHLVKRDEKATLEVRNVRNAQGKLMSTQAQEFLAVDKVRPTLVETEVTANTGAKTFKVELSEPLKIDANTKFYFNGLEVKAPNKVELDKATDSTQTVKQASTLVVTLEKALTAGTHEFTIVGLQDYNGNTNAPNPAKVAVKVAGQTAEAPVVLATEQIADNQISILFDKEIVSTGDVAAELTFKNLKNDGNDVKVKLLASEAGVEFVNKKYYAKDDVKEQYLLGYLTVVEFTDVDSDDVYLTSNTIIRDIEVANHAVVIDSTKAAEGSNLAYGKLFTKKLTLQKDLLAPKAIDMEVVKGTAVKDTIEITFKDAPYDLGIKKGAGNVVAKLTNEGVTATVVFNEEGKLVGADGQATSTAIATVTFGTDAVTILLDKDVEEVKHFFNAKDELKPGAKLEVTIPDGFVTDDGDKKIGDPIRIIKQTLTFNISGSTTEESAPQTNEKKIKFDESAERISIEFDGENIDPKTATNKANYKLDGISLPAGAYVEYEEKADGKKLVYINLPQNTIEFAGNYVLTVSGVATKTGAEMLPVTKALNLVDNTQPVLKAFEVKGDTEVIVTFNEAITIGSNGTEAALNFEVLQGSTSLTVATVADGANANQLKLTLAENPKTDITKISAVLIDLDRSGDMYVVDDSNNKAKAQIKVTK